MDIYLESWNYLLILVMVKVYSLFNNNLVIIPRRYQFLKILVHIIWHLFIVQGNEKSSICPEFALLFSFLVHPRSLLLIVSTLLSYHFDEPSII